MVVSSRTKRLSIEIGIVTAVVLASSIYWIRNPRSDFPPWGWTSLSMFTLLFFGGVLSRYRNLWNRYKFWASFAAMLVCHLAFSVFIFPPSRDKISGPLLITILCEGLIFPKLLRRIEQNAYQSEGARQG
jgi:hypothetical protein